jgi:hypothetical protein
VVFAYPYRLKCSPAASTICSRTVWSAGPRDGGAEEVVALIRKTIPRLAPLDN